MIPKCSNEKCKRMATVQFDHCGKLTYYCDEDWAKYKNIMDAIGSPVPISYPVGTKTN